ncbi:hypothetical protein [Neosynechococcus sphagnicola]|nr:hypothetical protein [Neosynechococcus sphagnicola]
MLFADLGYQVVLGSSDRDRAAQKLGIATVAVLSGIALVIKR